MNVGDKVMCVDVNWGPRWGGVERPVLGGIYVIRGSRKTGGLLLAGISNPIFSDGEEYGFFRWHFRKLDDIPDKVPALAAEHVN